MLRSIKSRARVLAIHGILALCLGMALLFLSGTMTNLIFEALAVVIAILLAAMALILAAVADWFAAWSEGTKHLHRLTFYLCAGLALALAGVFLGTYSQVTVQWLVLLAAIHALVFGFLGFTLAWKENHHALERRSMYIFATISVLFSALMAALFEQLDDPSATTMLGIYLCFVAAKQFFLAWDFHRIARVTEKSGFNARHEDSALSVVN